VYVSGFLFVSTKKKTFHANNKETMCMYYIAPNIVNESKLKIFLVKMCNTIILSIQIIINTSTYAIS
jgi:hypothetical protein